MSDSSPTDTTTSPQRWLKSPFNNEIWPVPPEVSEALYQYLIQPHIGFVPVDPNEKPKQKAHK